MHIVDKSRTKIFFLKLTGRERQTTRKKNKKRKPSPDPLVNGDAGGGGLAAAGRNLLIRTYISWVLGNKIKAAPDLFWTFFVDLKYGVENVKFGFQRKRLLLRKGPRVHAPSPSPPTSPRFQIKTVLCFYSPSGGEISNS